MVLSTSMERYREYLDVLWEAQMSGGLMNRPLIDYEPNATVTDPCAIYSGLFTHSGSTMRVVLRRDKISVGCSDVTVRALRQLLAEYDKRFGSDEVVLQP